MMRWLWVLLFLWGCERPAAIERTARPPRPAPSSVDGRDQYALAQAIVAAQRADDPDARAKVIKAWQGRRYRWELAFVPALCTSVDRCLLAPFDHARFDKPVAQGWLPRLAVDAKTFAALRKRCGAKRQCVVGIEARLAKLRLSSELPTQLVLDGVELMDARDARPDESWIVARARVAKR